jgi:hypothetical protein
MPLNFCGSNAEGIAMANISRPFQIALIGVVVLAGVWLFALRGSGSNSNPSSSVVPASTPAPTAASQAKKAAAPTHVYHGSAPGVSGLTSAIAKAHGAVTTSQANEKQLESRSAQASGNAASSNSTPATSTPAARSTGGTAAATAPKSTTAPKTASATHGASSTTHRQRQVEAKLSAGDVVLVLFWNKKGADDRADLAAVRSFARGHAKTAVEIATGKEVAAFGTITRGVQIYGTPTVLVVGRSGKAIVLTGLTDPFSLSQAISQARHAKS